MDLFCILCLDHCDELVTRLNWYFKFLERIHAVQSCFVRAHQCDRECTLVISKSVAGGWSA